MDKAYIVIVSFAFLLLALLHYILGKVSNGRRSRKGAVQQPPSLRAIPFLGHLHLVEKPFHASLWRLAARLGPVYSLRLGSRRAVVVSSSECATECFTEHDVTFANRPRFPAQLLVSFDGTALVTSSYGPHWRNLRRVAAVHLLSTNRVASMSGVIAAEVRAMAHRLCHAAAAAPGGAARVQMKRTLFQLSLSVLMETIAHTKGTRSEADVSMDMSVEAQEFKKVIDRIVPHLGAANMWDYLPVMQWFDVFGVRNKILDAVSRRDAFLRQLIDAVRRRLADGGSDGDKKSMIAVLLTLQKTEPEVYNDTMITALCAAQVALMRMELLQLVEVRIEEVARPLREEVATLKSLLVCVDDSLELAEACTSGGLGLALAQASSLLESTKQKSSVVEEHLYGCVSPRGSPCSLLQPVLSAASKSKVMDGIMAPVLQITPELHELSEESVVVFPLELGSFRDLAVATTPSPSQSHASVGSGRVWAHNSEALFAKELCSLLASLEAVNPGYGKDVACVLAGKASEGLIRKVGKSLSKAPRKTKTRKRGISRKASGAA